MIAREIVSVLLRDLQGRSGLGNEYEMIDPDIQEELRVEWEGKVRSILERTGEPTVTGPPLDADAQGLDRQRRTL